jgi:hypothetical protein
MIRRFFSALPARDWVKPSSDISGMEECKIPAWARDNMFRDQQAVFSFPQFQFFRGEFHFDLLLLQCILNCIALSIGSLFHVCMYVGV